MRLRSKIHGIDEAIHGYSSHIILSGQEAYKGRGGVNYLNILVRRIIYGTRIKGEGPLLQGMSEAYQMLTS